MNPGTLAILLLCGGLAAANGANDVSKAVATLAGAGVTRYRAAVGWGVAATLLGSMLSLVFASGISTIFTTGIVTASPQPSFALAVLAGALSWVAMATVTRLPVSTTHAIVGALIGAGLMLAPGSVLWSSLAAKVVAPLLLSVVVSYAIAAALSRLLRRAPRCLCVEIQGLAPAPADLALISPSSAPTSAAMAVASGASPRVRLLATQTATCPVHDAAARRLGININGGHWVSSAAIGIARGLNDTPKIWALGAFALVPLHIGAMQLLTAVALAMAIGGVLAGIRVTRRLAEDVIRIGDREGFAANLTTAILVATGAGLGLPMSTTHVSTGAITGIAGGDLQRLHGRTLRDFVAAWTVTPVVAGLVAAGVYLLLGR